MGSAAKGLNCLFLYTLLTTWGILLSSSIESTCGFTTNRPHTTHSSKSTWNGTYTQTLCLKDQPKCRKSKNSNTEQKNLKTKIIQKCMFYMPVKLCSWNLSTWLDVTYYFIYLYIYLKFANNGISNIHLYRAVQNQQHNKAALTALTAAIKPNTIPKETQNGQTRKIYNAD